MTKNKWILTDHVSRTSSQYLKSALCSHFNSQTPLTPTQIPKGYHFLYFNSKSEESALSFDGYDSHQAPLEPFKRRMWVSGELNFFNAINFNEQSFCVENVERIRKIKNSNLITINREILNNDGEIALVEKRSLIYLNDLYDKSNLLSKKSIKQAQFKHTLTPTEILLFRYSALTFNSHKIHYDKLYAKTEGYPDLLVHGPLTVTMMLEWIQGIRKKGDEEVITNFKYKNIRPLFVGDAMTLCSFNDVNNRKWDVWIENNEGILSFEGVINYIVNQ